MSQNSLVTYAAYYGEDDIRMSSSSGAIFSVLAEYALSAKGVVYGVAMTEYCKDAQFVRICNINELYRLRGSKYFQARVGDAYKTVENDLKQGKDVLFTGTGCQINGLKAFLGKDYDNLVCVDVICHGVPSPAVWRKYVEEKEKQLGSKLKRTEFRCKDNGWETFGMKLVKDNETSIFIPMSKDSFMKMFLKNYTLRPSCYECVAKKVKKSDLTIADFWGIDSVAPEMNDGKGTSLVLIRTGKGMDLFDRISTKLKVKQVTYEEGVRGNPSEYKSVIKPAKRDAFFKDFIDACNNGVCDVGKLADKYCRESIIIGIKRSFKRILRKKTNLKK
ncbi:MAG: coenzyme F420-reducing hydrogenase, beta subunit [Lachnospiraceae bacterium]|nr:coenzyme F420-reducing hydrogenase, beta subunit [Lachnospiraceae bacterium]